MALLLSGAARAGPLEAWAVAQGAACTRAITAAERKHGIPPGLLLAIGTVESGRPLPPRGRLAPWPWTTDAEGAGAYYETKEAALAGAQGALLRSRNLDVGCMQISMLHHPQAFPTLEAAFDPAANADYAARFLRRLQTGPAAGDWGVAAGMYHSQTAALADPYRARVEAILSGRPLPRGGTPLLFTRAVQEGPVRIDVTEAGVRITRLTPAPGRTALTCQMGPGRGMECR